jgi:hypothetical protein
VRNTYLSIFILTGGTLCRKHKSPYSYGWNNLCRMFNSEYSDGRDALYRTPNSVGRGSLHSLEHSIHYIHIVVTSGIEDETHTHTGGTRCIEQSTQPAESQNADLVKHIQLQFPSRSLYTVL